MSDKEIEEYIKEGGDLYIVTNIDTHRSSGNFCITAGRYQFTVDKDSGISFRGTEELTELEDKYLRYRTNKFIVSNRSIFYKLEKSLSQSPSNGWLSLSELKLLSVGDKLNVHALTPSDMSKVMSKVDSTEVESVDSNFIKFKGRLGIPFSELSEEGVKNNGMFSHVFKRLEVAERKPMIGALTEGEVMNNIRENFRSMEPRTSIQYISEDDGSGIMSQHFNREE